MRTTFSFCLFTALMLIPSGCFYSSHNIANIVKVDCSKLQNKIQIPNVPSVTISSSYCEDYLFKPEVVGHAIKIFVKDFSQEFDVEEHVLWSYLSGLEIEVSIFPRQVDAAYDAKGNYLSGEVHVSGLALSPKRIWVEIKTSQIWSSSLVHELVHIIIWNQNQGVHGDPDHEGTGFSGWKLEHTKFIERLNFRFQDSGI